MKGTKHSPYLTTKIIGWGEDFIRGDASYCDNPFQWFNICITFSEDP